MDLAKIGKFIQEQRKNKKLTQAQLAEKLYVSEKTISKWECGKGFPDTTLMLPLCEVLGISSNELLSGKILTTDKEYKEVAEKNIILLKGQNEKHTKHLLAIEWVLIWFSMVVFIGSLLVSSYVELDIVWRILLIVFGVMNIVLGLLFSLFIETKVGYYECKCCSHKYVPSYSQVLWAMHMGRTRYMKCPKCGKKSWNKKVINAD